MILKKKLELQKRENGEFEKIQAVKHEEELKRREKLFFNLSTPITGESHNLLLKKLLLCLESFDYLFSYNEI